MPSLFFFPLLCTVQYFNTMTLSNPKLQGSEEVYVLNYWMFMKKNEQEKKWEVFPVLCIWSSVIAQNWPLREMLHLWACLSHGMSAFSSFICIPAWSLLWTGMNFVVLLERQSSALLSVCTLLKLIVHLSVTFVFVNLCCTSLITLSFEELCLIFTRPHYSDYSQMEEKHAACFA